MSGQSALQTPANTTELIDAVETFAFSQLPKRNRIALVLAGIFGGEAETYLDKADEIEFYASANFAIPYRAPKNTLDTTMGDVLS